MGVMTYFQNQNNVGRYSVNGSISPLDFHYPKSVPIQLSHKPDDDDDDDTPLLPSLTTADTTSHIMAPFSIALPTRSGGSSNGDLLLTTSLSTLTLLSFVQLCTPADPLGKSLRFLKQLKRQVSSGC